jgi:hypothetical protein
MVRLPEASSGGARAAIIIGLDSVTDPSTLSKRGGNTPVTSPSGASPAHRSHRGSRKTVLSSILVVMLAAMIHPSFHASWTAKATP